MAIVRTSLTPTSPTQVTGAAPADNSSELLVGMRYVDDSTMLMRVLEALGTRIHVTLVRADPEAPRPLTSLRFEV